MFLSSIARTALKLAVAAAAAATVMTNPINPLFAAPAAVPDDGDFIDVHRG